MTTLEFTKPTLLSSQHISSGTSSQKQIITLSKYAPPGSIIIICIRESLAANVTAVSGCGATWIKADTRHGPVPPEFDYTISFWIGSNLNGGTSILLTSNGSHTKEISISVWAGLENPGTEPTILSLWAQGLSMDRFSIMIDSGTFIGSLIVAAICPDPPANNIIPYADYINNLDMTSDLPGSSTLILGHAISERMHFGSELDPYASNPYWLVLTDSDGWSGNYLNAAVVIRPTGPGSIELSPASNDKLHFELRADTSSGAEDDVSVELVWIKNNGVRVSLGYFTSNPSTVDGDAPWTVFDIGVDLSMTGRLEIYKISGNDNAHIRNLWIDIDYVPPPPPREWYSQSQRAEVSTLLYRSAPTSWRLYDNPGEDAYGVYWLSLPALTAGKTYRLGYYMKDIIPYNNHRTYLQISGNGPYQDVLDGGEHSSDGYSGILINNTSWTLIEGEFVCSAAVGGINNAVQMLVQTYGELGVFFSPWPYFETFVDDMFCIEVGGDGTNLLDPIPGTYAARDYGQFPKGVPYTADVQDGVYNSIPILNDGGSSGQEYFAETGETIPPDIYNYSIDWTTGPFGNELFAYQHDNWIQTNAYWRIGAGFGAYLSGRGDNGNPPIWGLPSFTWDTRDWYTSLRHDGLSTSSYRELRMTTITAGSRGMGDIGPIWGWNSWSDFFFALNGGHGRAGVYRMSGGVVTKLFTPPINALGGEIRVKHDFATGDLHVEFIEYMFGSSSNYYGNHPHVSTGKRSGWLGDQQNGGIFYDTTGCANWSLTFSPGHVAYKRQFSMQALSVVDQDPLTWFFGPAFTPPMRQRGRDDGLGSDTRQERGFGSSQQSSLRRGGRTYY